MKKHHAKRKKVVIDIIDGKIINEPVALKLENVEEYVEKNGFKLLKIFSTIIIVMFSFVSVKAIDIIDLNLSNLPTYKLAFTLNLLIILFVLSVICIFVGLKYNVTALYLLGCIILLFLGIMIIANGFNPLIGLFVCFISVFFVWSLWG